MIRLEDLEYISFAGGGTAGTAFEGIVSALTTMTGGDEAFGAWRDRVRGVAGTSAGAIYALVFVLENDSRKRIELARSIRVNQIVSISHLDRFHQTYGMSNMNELQRFIEHVLVTCGLSPTATLNDLFRFTRMETTFVASDLVTRSTVCLNHHTFPTLTIVQAVCASCAIPLLYSPMRLGERILVDGCLTSSVPDCFLRAKTLFVLFDTPNVQEPEDVFSYVRMVCACATKQQRFTDETSRNVLRVCLKYTKSFDIWANLMDGYRDGLCSAYDVLTQGVFRRTLNRVCHLYVQNCVEVDVTNEAPPVSTY